MNHAANVVSGKDFLHQFLVRNIALDENVARIVPHFRQIRFIGGVRHLVQIDKRDFGMRFEKIRNEVRPDEPRAARH